MVLRTTLYYYGHVQSRRLGLGFGLGLGLGLLPPPRSGTYRIRSLGSSEGCRWMRGNRCNPVIEVDDGCLFVGLPSSRPPFRLRRFPLTPLRRPPPAEIRRIPRVI